MSLLLSSLAFCGDYVCAARGRGLVLLEPKGAREIFVKPRLHSAQIIKLAQAGEFLAALDAEGNVAVCRVYIKKAKQTPALRVLHRFESNSDLQSLDCPPLARKNSPSTSRCFPKELRSLERKGVSDIALFHPHGDPATWSLLVALASEACVGPPQAAASVSVVEVAEVRPEAPRPVWLFGLHSRKAPVYNFARVSVTPAGDFVAASIGKILGCWNRAANAVLQAKHSTELSALALCPKSGGPVAAGDMFGQLTWWSLADKSKFVFKASATDLVHADAATTTTSSTAARKAVVLQSGVNHAQLASAENAITCKNQLSVPVPLVASHWHAHPVAACLWSPDGETLYTAGEEAVVVIWRGVQRSYKSKFGQPIVGLALQNGVLAALLAGNGIKIFDLCRDRVIGLYDSLRLPLTLVAPFDGRENRLSLDAKDALPLRLTSSSNGVVCSYGSGVTCSGLGPSACVQLLRIGSGSGSVSPDAEIQSFQSLGLVQINPQTFLGRPQHNDLVDDQWNVICARVSADGQRLVTAEARRIGLDFHDDLSLLFPPDGKREVVPLHKWPGHPDDSGSSPDPEEQPGRSPKKSATTTPVNFGSAATAALEAGHAMKTIYIRNARKRYFGQLPVESGKMYRLKFWRRTQQQSQSQSQSQTDSESKFVLLATIDNPHLHDVTSIQELAAGADNNEYVWLSASLDGSARTWSELSPVAGSSEAQSSASSVICVNTIADRRPILQTAVTKDRTVAAFLHPTQVTLWNVGAGGGGTQLSTLQCPLQRVPRESRLRIPGADAVAFVESVVDAEGVPSAGLCAVACNDGQLYLWNLLSGSECLPMLEDMTALKPQSSSWTLIPRCSKRPVPDVVLCNPQARMVVVYQVRRSGGSGVTNLCETQRRQFPHRIVGCVNCEEALLVVDSCLDVHRWSIYDAKIGGAAEQEELEQLEQGATSDEEAIESAETVDTVDRPSLDEGDDANDQPLPCPGFVNIFLSA